MIEDEGVLDLTVDLTTTTSREAVREGHERIGIVLGMAYTLAASSRRTLPAVAGGDEGVISLVGGSGVEVVAAGRAATRSTFPPVFIAASHSRAASLRSRPWFAFRAYNHRGGEVAACRDSRKPISGINGYQLLSRRVDGVVLLLPPASPIGRFEILEVDEWS